MNFIKTIVAGIAAYLFFQNSKSNTIPAPTIPTPQGEGNNTSPSPTPIQINDIVDSLPKHPTKTYGTRSLSLIDRLLIHHSATTSGSALAYANFHIEEPIYNSEGEKIGGGNGWPGIAYHFVVDKDGTIHQTNRLTTRSYHVSGQNTGGIGICMTGNYDIQYPPEQQIESVILLCRYLSFELGKFLPIYGHNHFSTKTCPGNHVDVAAIQEQVYAPV